MEKYLLELIKDHNRVIVPNFGAFIVSREKGQTILFNSFLSFNDGLLINHICKVDGVDSATAMTSVEDFVNTIKEALDAKGVYEFKHLGTFTKDQNGILRFIQKEKEGEAKTESAPPKTTPKKEPSDLLDMDAGGVTKAEIIEEPLKPESTSGKDKLLIIDNTPPVTQVNKPTPKPEPKKPVTKPVASKNPVEKEKTQPVQRGLPLWLVILLIVLPILLILGYFLFIKRPKKEVPPPPPPVEQPVVQEPVEEPVVEETPVVEVPEPVIATRQHHIILGSFKDEANASKLVARLKEKGLSNASVLNYQGRFLVSAEWYSSVNTALQRQEDLLKELQMENWVLTLK